MKECSKCKIIKPLDEFYKNKSKFDGLQSGCKKCDSEYHKKYRLKNKEKILKRHKKYYQNNKKQILKQHKKYSTTEQGKEAERKHSYKRRNLGFYPVNDWFKDCNAHHLNYNLVLYIPVELHKSISHSVTKNKNMIEINRVAWDWFFTNIK